MIRDAELIKSRIARLLKNIISKKVSFLFIDVLIEAKKVITL